MRLLFADIPSRWSLDAVSVIDLYAVSPARRRFVEHVTRKFSGGGSLRAVATNAPDAVIDHLLTEHGLQNAVQRIDGPETVGFLKPSRAFFERVLGRQHVEPEETLLVANSIPNDLPAASCGIHVCIIPRRTEICAPKDLCQCKGGSDALVYVTRSVTKAWAWIDRHFVAAT
ncbi:HAD family hydrolase [Patescibacteria group bacterium]|nr:HAD family hydrolase [Patescibacteria group bacterium]